LEIISLEIVLLFSKRFGRTEKSIIFAARLAYIFWRPKPLEGLEG